MDQSDEPGPASSPDAYRLHQAEARGWLDRLSPHGVVVLGLIGLLIVMSIWALLLLMMM